MILPPALVPRTPANAGRPAGACPSAYWETDASARIERAVRYRTNHEEQSRDSRSQSAASRCILDKTRSSEMEAPRHNWHKDEET